MTPSARRRSIERALRQRGRSQAGPDRLAPAGSSSPPSTPQSSPAAFWSIGAPGRCGQRVRGLVREVVPARPRAPTRGPPTGARPAGPTPACRRCRPWTRGFDSVPCVTATASCSGSGADPHLRRPCPSARRSRGAARAPAAGRRSDSRAPATRFPAVGEKSSRRIGQRVRPEDGEVLVRERRARQGVVEGIPAPREGAEDGGDAPGLDVEGAGASRGARAGTARRAAAHRGCRCEPGPRGRRALPPRASTSRFNRKRRRLLRR